MNKDTNLNKKTLLHKAVPISIINLTFSYKDLEIFKNFNYTFAAGKTTAILGQSGIGKTSLLKLIANINTPENGTIISDNRHNLLGDVSYMDQNDLLLPWLSVLKNVDLGSRLRGEKPRYDIARKIINEVGLKKYSLNMPHTLSGGMRQRVALARTLIETGQIVLMDEPFSALDAITRNKLQTLAAKLLKEKTVILITHDPLEALRLGDVIIILEGSPVKVKYSFEFNEPTPRELDNAFMAEKYRSLISKLTN